MNDARVVADASAILALLKQEPMTLIEPRRLFGAAISTVTLSEVVERLCNGGATAVEADIAIATLELDVVAFTASHARAAAHLRPLTRQAGLSLADRACLSLGLDLGLSVATADRAWSGVKVGVEIVLIR